MEGMEEQKTRLNTELAIEKLRLDLLKRIFKKIIPLTLIMYWYNIATSKLYLNLSP
jgi:hypothetical protein